MKEFEYLSELNDAQREGVENIEGPSMIIAGAGSGKTRVLTYRIAHLIRAYDVDPFHILALTFTNKAAREMRERIERVVGVDARSLWMGTFHSVFARILRSEAEKIHYPRNFTIYDTDDSRNLIKIIVKEMNLDDKTYKASTVHNRISAAKNRLIGYKEYNSNPVFMAEDAESMKPQLGTIYKTYQERLFRSGSMDFDDLLFNTNILLTEHPDVLLKYQHRFRYVLVDEFQDTNHSQYLITRKLSAVHQNISVVGDDAQSIYAFRGADIQNILNFERDYPDLKVYKLEQNYRSTKTIVNAANSVILKNKAQLRKNVWTDNHDGSLIELLRANSDSEEGKLIASSIFEERMNHQASNNEFAILYRTNSQSRAIEEALRRRNIKYKIIGGLSFYQRREIKDLLAYMKFTVNPNDEQAFRRIINLPKRGIGPTTVDKIILAAYDHDITITEVINNAQMFLPGRAAMAVGNFAQMIEIFRKTMAEEDAYNTAVEIAKRSGLLTELYNDKSLEGVSRYENAQELLNAIKEFVDDDELEREKDMAGFLQEVALLTGVDSDSDDDNDKVTLMTIHMAKGLEFNYIYISGLEEDLFPSQLMLSSRADLEEERRLFYVAITRAKEKLFMSYAQTRYRYGRLKHCEPSRFLDEVDPQFIKINQRYSSSFVPPAYQTNYAKNLVDGIRKEKKNQPLKRTNYRPPEDFTPSDTSGLSAGMKVEHPKFGYGKVTNIDESGPNRKAKVYFDDFGEKTLLLSFAKLRIHTN